MEATSKAAEGNRMSVALKLAHNEKEVRDKAVVVMERWMSKKENISEMEMKKIWRALYYCMWHSDKPVIQHELAERLASLMHALPDAHGQLLYAKVFFWTMKQHWSSIPYLRLDKYYVLIRRMLENCFAYLRQRGWDPENCKELMDAFAEDLFCSDDERADRFPRGVVYHMCDIYLAELDGALKSYRPEVPEDTVTTLLEPFLDILSKGSDLTTTARVCSRVFGALLDGLEGLLSGEAIPSDLSVFFRLDMNRLIELLMARASAKDTREENRAQLYALHRRAHSLEAALEAAAAEEEEAMLAEMPVGEQLAAMEAAIAAYPLAELRGMCEDEGIEVTPLPSKDGCDDEALGKRDEEGGGKKKKKKKKKKKSAEAEAGDEEGRDEHGLCRGDYVRAMVAHFATQMLADSSEEEVEDGDWIGEEDKEVDFEWVPGLEDGDDEVNGDDEVGVNNLSPQQKAELEAKCSESLRKVRSDLENLSRRQMRQRLRNMGLNGKGNRQVLLERLVSQMSAQIRAGLGLGDAATETVLQEAREGKKEARQKKKEKEAAVEGGGDGLRKRAREEKEASAAAAVAEMQEKARRASESSSEEEEAEVNSPLAAEFPDMYAHFSGHSVNTLVRYCEATGIDVEPAVGKAGLISAILRNFKVEEAGGENGADIGREDDVSSSVDGDYEEGGSDDDDVPEADLMEDGSGDAGHMEEDDAELQRYLMKESDSDDYDSDDGYTLMEFGSAEVASTFLGMPSLEEPAVATKEVQPKRSSLQKKRKAEDSPLRPAVTADAAETSGAIPLPSKKKRKKRKKKKKKQAEGAGATSSPHTPGKNRLRFSGQLNHTRFFKGSEPPQRVSGNPTTPSPLKRPKKGILKKRAR